MKFKNMSKFWKAFTVISTVMAITFLDLSIWYFVTNILPMLSVMM